MIKSSTVGAFINIQSTCKPGHHLDPTTIRKPYKYSFRTGIEPATRNAIVLRHCAKPIFIIILQNLLIRLKKIHKNVLSCNVLRELEVLNLNYFGFQHIFLGIQYNKAFM